MSSYFIELPNFAYDKQALFDYQKNNVNWTANIHYKTGGIDTASMGFFDHYVTDDCNGTILPVMEKINLPLSFKDFKFNKLIEGGNMPFHIDPHRHAVFMIPLTEDPAKVEWRDEEGNVLAEHAYKYPTIINSQILHGVPYSHNERIFLQARIDKEWDYIQENFMTMFS